MAHFPKPFYREPLKRWYVQFDGKQVSIGADPNPTRDRKTRKPIPPQAVLDLYHEMMAGRKDDRPVGLPTSDLAVTIVDRFLDWV